VDPEERRAALDRRLDKAGCADEREPLLKEIVEGRANYLVPDLHGGRHLPAPDAQVPDVVEVRGGLYSCLGDGPGLCPREHLKRPNRDLFPTRGALVSPHDSFHRDRRLLRGGLYRVHRIRRSDAALRRDLYVAGAVSYDCEDEASDRVLRGDPALDLDLLAGLGAEDLLYPQAPCLALHLRLSGGRNGNPLKNVVHVSVPA